MTKKEKQRFEELERRVRWLEFSPRYYPAYVPVPVYPSYVPATPVYPSSPWWGAGTSTITCGGGAGVGGQGSAGSMNNLLS